MNLERGFRRVTTVISLAVIGCGVLFSVALIWAWIMASRLDNELEKTLAAEGCPSQQEKQLVKSTQVVVVLGSGRWRVMIPRGNYVDAYVVNSNRDLSSTEVVRAAQSGPSVSDLNIPDVTRTHPAAGVEVIDCILESAEIFKAQSNARSSRLIKWWVGQPLFLYSTGWVVGVLPDSFDWLLPILMVLSALILTAIAAGVPWGVFYLMLWVAQGFREN
jgi:hypothetical protein